MNPSSFQVSDPAIAAGLIALGCPRAYTSQLIRGRSSQTRDRHEVTWHFRAGQYDPQEIAIGKGLHPLHPFCATQAAIATYQRLSFPVAEMSLVPLHPKAFLAGGAGLTVLRQSAANDGNLLPLAAAARVDLPGFAPEFAAPLLTVGFPVRAGLDYRRSLTFPQLTLSSACEAILAVLRADGQTAAPNPLQPGDMVLTHALPGFPPGEHPIYYAACAVAVYLAISVKIKPRTVLLQGAHAALLSLTADAKTVATTEKFLTQGASALGF